jgi:ATP-dependent Lon protease
MEIIDLHGYTEEDKQHITYQYLIRRQTEENGLKPDQIEFTADAVSFIIRHYTREAGVRSLERQIGTICRKQARHLVEGKTEKLVVTREVVQEMLGGIKVRVDTEIANRTKHAGVVVGLAWTPTGGDILFIEAMKMKGKGEFRITGQIQDVMRESMQAAFSWVRAHSSELQIDDKTFTKCDLHIHVPAGAIPKDGPSAGVTIVTALVSLLTDKKVRPLTAMTGEITLSGNVLPIGGVKEKFLAAKRAGVKDIIFPSENRQNVEEDILPEQMEGVNVHYVESIEDVLNLALPQSPAEARQDAETREQVLADSPK